MGSSWAMGDEFPVDELEEAHGLLRRPEDASESLQLEQGEVVWLLKRLHVLAVLFSCTLLPVGFVPTVSLRLCTWLRSPLLVCTST